MEFLTMSDGNRNAFHSWVPEGDVAGVVVLSHGMAEHAARYGRFAGMLNSEGIALYAEDHRGHGQTAKLAKEKGLGDYGYLADKDGFFRVVDDIHEEVLEVKKRFPGKKVVLFGHSFGSFVSQCFIEKYGQDVDACVLCGTAGPRNAIVGVAKCLGTIVKCFSGKKKVSKFMDNLAFGAYNNKIPSPRTKFDWLSRDNAQVDAYIADPWCGFVCTTGFFCDMFAGLSFVHNAANMRRIPKTLPVHFIDGTGDPVGDYAKTVEQLCSIYKANGMEKVSIKLFEEARHELLNETNYQEVQQDVLNFIKANL